MSPFVVAMTAASSFPLMVEMGITIEPPLSTRRKPKPWPIVLKSACNFLSFLSYPYLTDDLRRRGSGAFVPFIDIRQKATHAFGVGQHHDAGRIQAGLRCSLVCRLSSFTKTLLLTTMAWRTWRIDISKAQANLQRRVV